MTASVLIVYLLFKCRFCGLTKGISPKICILCVCVKILNKRSFEPFCVWSLFKRHQQHARRLSLSHAAHVNAPWPDELTEVRTSGLYLLPKTIICPKH